MVGMHIPRPIRNTLCGTSYSASSWFQMICCIGVPPRPPHSFGQVMPANPASAFFACHALARAISAASVSP